MSWEYFLRPEPPATTFSQAALDEMRAYLERLPTYHPSDAPDDFLLVDTFEARDRIVRRGLVDVPNTGAAGIGLTPADVVLSVQGYDILIEILATFLYWCQERWPSRLFDLTEAEVTPEVFVEQLKWVGKDRQ